MSQPSLKSKFGFYTKEIYLDLLFFLFIGILLVNSVLIYLRFSTQYIDSDQVLIWAGASDYSKGLFYEPRYYGQSYNTLLESLVAVPFIKCHMPVYYAVPLATQLLFLFPIVFTSCYLYARNMKVNAVLVLALMLCLTNGYYFLNSMPRGFITGLFFTSFFIVNMVDPKKLAIVFINTVLGVLGYFVNPNSILVTAPFLFYVFLHNYRNKKYYYVTAIGLVSYAPFYFLLDHFYKVHSDYAIFNINYELSLKYFVNSFDNLDQRFGHITFFVEYQSVILFITIIVLGVFLYNRDLKALAAYILFIILLLLTFISAKTMDGTKWVYFSYSRMYLGVPLLFCLMLGVAKIWNRNFWTLFCLLPIFNNIIKFNSLDEEALKDAKEQRSQVSAISLAAGLDIIDVYGKVCIDNKSGVLLVSGGNFAAPFLGYGAYAAREHYPITIVSRYERRYWMRQAQLDTVYNRMVFLSPAWDFDKRVIPKDFKIKRLDDYGLFLITENHLTKRELLEFVNTVESGNQ
jgi:hypothetical protein